MAQVSYGTITITDTNDIESVVIEYNRNQSTTTPPAQTDSGWSTNRPTWAQGYYIWQRTRTHKSGTQASEDILGNAVCLTGSTGQTGATGRGVTGVETLYATNNSATTAPTSGWQTQPPTYDSSKPKYWVKVTTTYNSGNPDVATYLDNGITDAMATAAAANSTANTANQTANNAKDKADSVEGNLNNYITSNNSVISALQTKTKYFWTNLVAHTNGSGGWTKPNYPVGTYAASGISGTTFDEENSSTYGYNTLYANGIKLRYNAINLGELTGSSLIFYRPSTTAQGSKGMELTSTTLKFYDSTGSVAQATFGGTQATISGTINVYDGKIGNNANNYWYIGNYTDYNQNTSAIIKSIGTASIQLNETDTWRVSTNRIHTAWAPETGTDAFKLHFPLFMDSNSNNKHWDFGLHLPTSYSDKFLYVRNAPSTQTLDNLLNDLEDGGYNYWSYKFYIDASGNVHSPSYYIINSDGSEQPLSGSGLVASSLSCGTVGSVTHPVYFNSGVPALTTYELNAAGAKGVVTDIAANSSSTNLPTAAAVVNYVTSRGYLTVDEKVKVENKNTTKLWITGTATSSTNTGTLAYDSNIYIDTTVGELHATTFNGYTLAAASAKGVDTSLTATSTSTNLPTSKAIADLIKQYLPLTGGSITGPVNFGDSVSIDDLTVGNLIVNGAGRFTNGLYGDLIGNADTATKVGNDLKIQLNGGTTEGTNQFTFNGSAAKTVNITKSSIGLGNVENTALSTWTGSNKIVTLGTITTGTWNGSAIPVANGGTGATTAANARTNLGLGTAATKAVDSSISAASTSENLPTSKAVAAFVEGKGYSTTTGTVTSVRVQASSPLQSSTSTAQSATLNTTISFANQNANTVLAGPSGGSSAAAPSFRSLVAADIPDISGTYYLASNPSGYTTNTGTVTSVKVQGANGLTGSGTVTTSGTITISHDDTSSQASSSNSGRTYIQSVTLDGYGHVTGLSTATETVTNTHYTANLITGASATAKANAAVTTNGSVYLNLVENDTVRNAHKIVGSGTTTVTSDANGIITISSTDSKVGTVTSITLTQGTGISIGSSGTAITTSGSRTIALADNYGDTKNPYASKTARYVLAAPANAAGVPTFRALTKEDVGLGSVLNELQVTGIGQGDDGKIRVYKGSSSYEDIAVEIVATESSTVASAQKLSSYGGSNKQPVYFPSTGTKAGKPVAIDYTIEKSVPSNAVFTDTTYTFTNGTNGFTVTPLGGTAQTVTVTPFITNNITGSGTSGYLAKFNGANTITNGPALGTGTTKFLREDGTWVVPSGSVTGVKGDSESSYRIGQINITKANIGLGNVDNTADANKNVLTATKFSSSRTIALTGDVTGSASGDGSSGWSISTTVGDDSHNHTVDTIIPKQTKTYTNVVATANNDPNGWLYFAKFKPVDNSTSVMPYIKYRIRVEAAGRTDSYQDSYVEYWMFGSNVCGYSTFNQIKNTSYRPMYNHSLYRATSTGITNGYGHLLGIRLTSSWNPATAANSRTVIIDIIETKNCTIEFLDNMVLYANAPGTGTTNYAGRSDYDGTTQGITISGDRNDVNYQNREYYGSRTTNSALYRYMICLTKSDGSLVPMNSVNNSTAKTKTLTTDSFDPFGEIFYWGSTTTYNTGANVGDGSWYREILCDLRYSFNCGGYTADGGATLTARLPLYLVAIPQSNGSAVLYSEPLTQILPSSDDGRIYIYLGRVYQDNYPYRVLLSLNHPVYWYKNGAIRQYINNETIVTTDQQPYHFRPSGGSLDIGDREYDTLVGASAVWNQLVQNGNFESTSGWSATRGSISASNNILSYTINELGSGTVQNRIARSVSLASGHKYIILVQWKPSKAYKLSIRLHDLNVEMYSSVMVSGAWNNIEKVFSCSGNNSSLFLGFNSSEGGSAVGDVEQARSVQIIDLTTFFGSSAIPDYVYTLEQSTAGSGVSWLRQHFPKLFEYHEYDAGTLKSVEGVESHDMVGFNQWDEEWEVGGYSTSTGEKGVDNSRIRSKNAIKCLPNTVYCNSSPQTAVMLFYDKNDNYLSYLGVVSNATFTTPANCHFVRFYMATAYGTTYNHDICINLSNSGYRNGEYEPYWKRSYPLDSTWVGRGIYKLGSDGKPYADGDTYESDGTVETRYGVVDLGTLGWNKANTPNNHWRFGATLNEVVKAVATTDVFNGICTKYNSVTPANTYDGVTGVSNNNASNTIFICDENYTDATAFKTAMSGVYLIYELATPTTAEYEPFQSPQICDDFGTEEYVTDCLIPVGHITEYTYGDYKTDKLAEIQNTINQNYISKKIFKGAYDLLYSSAINTPTRLAANTTTTKKFLQMTGTGSTGAAPIWDTVSKSDVGLGNVNNTADANKRVKGANITSTTNAIAYYTDTVGTFGSKASANGALYATSANGALQWGTLPAAQGGTGKTNLKDAANALINALDTGSSNLTSNDYVITQYVGGGTTTTTYHRRPASALRVGGLLTARKLKVALGSTTDKTFDGTADVTDIPISGTLGVAHGGTGVTSFTANSLIISGSSTTAALTTRAITNNTSNTAITNNNTNIPTMNTIYYGLVAVNGSSQSRATTIYVPTSVGSNGQYVKSGGSGAPSWQTPDTTPTSGSGNLITSGGVLTALSNYVTLNTSQTLTAAATKTYLGLQTYGSNGIAFGSTNGSSVTQKVNMKYDSTLEAIVFSFS